MRQGSNGRRPRGRPNRKQHGGSPRSNNFDSSGPEGRIRGNAHQVYEKYLALARDAASGGDRIAAEAYYQHAEHYFRILNASTDPASDHRGPGARYGGNGRGHDNHWTQPAQSQPDPAPQPQPDGGAPGPVNAVPAAAPAVKPDAQGRDDGQGGDGGQSPGQPRRRTRRMAAPTGDPATQAQPTIEPAPAAQPDTGSDPEPTTDGDAGAA